MPHYARNIEWIPPGTQKCLARVATFPVWFRAWHHLLGPPAIRRWVPLDFRQGTGWKKTSKKWDWSSTGGGFWMMFDWFCYGVYNGFLSLFVWQLMKGVNCQVTAFFYCLSPLVHVPPACFPDDVIGSSEIQRHVRGIWKAISRIKKSRPWFVRGSFEKCCFFPSYIFHLRWTYRPGETNIEPNQEKNMNHIVKWYYVSSVLGNHPP